MGLKITPKAQKQITSAQEAMAALQSLYWRQIARGRVVARMLALKNGTVSSREMVNYMIAEGSLVAGTHEHWVSVVFRDPMWEWTGKWTSRKKSVNTQGGFRPSRIWKLRAEYLILTQQ